VAILFADTGVGKSILAVQLAHSISAGLSHCCGRTNEAGQQTVLYYDFELSDRMFHQRYTDLETKEMHRFSDRFFRILIVSNGIETPETFEKQLFQSIENDVSETGATVLIVDNITALTMKTASDADTALLLMKQLKRFQMEKGLSILVFAHTTKIPKRYHALINAFTKQLDKNEWDEEECEAFKSKAERLLSAIEKNAEDLALDPEDLVVVDNLGFIIDLVTDTVEAEDLDDNGFLIFNLDEEDWEAVEALSELDDLDEAFGE